MAPRLRELLLRSRELAPRLRELQAERRRSEVEYVAAKIAHTTNERVSKGFVLPSLFDGDPARSPTPSFRREQAAMDAAADEGARCVDAVDGDLSEHVEVRGGPVRLDRPGKSTYHLLYMCRNHFGLAAVPQHVDLAMVPCSAADPEQQWTLPGAGQAGNIVHEATSLCLLASGCNDDAKYDLHIPYRTRVDRTVAINPRNHFRVDFRRGSLIFVDFR